MKEEFDFWFYIFYVVSTIILYATCVTTIFFIVRNSKENEVRSLKNNHPEVFKGVTIVIGVFVLLEFFTELIMAILWSRHVNDFLTDFIVFLAGIVYFSPGIFSLCKIVKKIHLYRTGRYNDYNDVLFKCFIWTISYFAYVLLYAFFPAFVLAFAYPVRVITVFVFIATFMILSVVYITTYISKGVTLKDFKGTRLDSIWIKIFVWSLIAINLVYFFLFIFALLYSLVIGRASVVSSAPLAILSLLPSILISIAAWLMRSTLMTHDGKISEDKDTVQDRTNILSTDTPDMDEQDNSEHIGNQKSDAIELSSIQCKEKPDGNEENNNSVHIEGHEREVNAVTELESSV